MSMARALRPSGALHGLPQHTPMLNCRHYRSLTRTFHQPRHGVQVTRVKRDDHGRGSQQPAASGGGGTSSKPAMASTAGQEEEETRYTGVHSHRQGVSRWRMAIKILGLGSLLHLGTWAAGRKGDAARAYDAACYLRDGGRGTIKNFPDAFKGLTPEQGTALAKQVLGPAHTRLLMDALSDRDKLQSAIAATRQQTATASTPPHSALDTAQPALDTTQPALDTTQPALDTTQPALDTTLTTTKEQPPVKAVSQQRMLKTSASVGVRLVAPGSWAAQLQVRTKTAYLGTYSSEEDAMRVYAAAWYLRNMHLTGSSTGGPGARKAPPFSEDYVTLPQSQGIARAKKVLGAVATDRVLKALSGSTNQASAQ